MNHAQQQHQTALTDLEGAIKYIIDGGNSHPNRLDVCAASKSLNTSNTQPQAFQPQSNAAFGRPTNTNSSTPAFGQQNGSFGQPSAPAPVSGFGQPSQLNSQVSNGTSGTTSFGKPTQLGANSGFGQPSQLGGGFGQAAQLGHKPNPFGPPSQPGSNVAFGQPTQPNPLVKVNPFAQHATAVSGFGGQGTTVTSGGFGQPSQPVNGGGFGQPSQPTASGGFGQPSQPVGASFGQPSQPALSNPFSRRQAAPSIGAFADPPSNQNVPYSGPGHSAQPSQPNSLLSAPPQLAQPIADSGSGSAAISYGTAGANLGSWPKDSTNNPIPFPLQVSNPYDATSSLAHPDVRTYSIRDPKNTLLAWKGRAVSYIDRVPCYKRADDGTWERIWFPDGPPPYNKGTELPVEEYDEATKDAYLYMRDNTVFKDGLMPMLPPRREWSKWDL